jgi:hypothetical protein
MTWMGAPADSSSTNTAITSEILFVCVLWPRVPSASVESEEERLTYLDGRCIYRQSLQELGFVSCKSRAGDNGSKLLQLVGGVRCKYSVCTGTYDLLCNTMDGWYLRRRGKENKDGRRPDVFCCEIDDVGLH